MDLIAATDIFGLTTEFERLISNVSDKYTSITIVDPYKGLRHSFQDENVAYRHFQKSCGVIGYSEMIKEEVAKKSVETILLGFSVGASAIWRLLGSSSIYPTTKMVGFYGSQIRDYTDINPIVETNLVFPKYEKHFDVQSLISTLKKKEQVNCLQTEYLHGFMNEKSLNYNALALAKYLAILDMMI